MLNKHKVQPPKKRNAILRAKQLTPGFKIRHSMADYSYKRRQKFSKPFHNGMIISKSGKPRGLLRTYCRKVIRVVRGDMGEFCDYNRALSILKTLKDLIEKRAPKHHHPRHERVI
jgi:hypothetical protein